MGRKHEIAVLTEHRHEVWFQHVANVLLDIERYSRRCCLELLEMLVQFVHLVVGIGCGGCSRSPTKATLNA